LAFVDQLQARAILYLKAEIVRVRSFGKPQLYKFWKFTLDETTQPIWTDQAESDVVVWLTTDYGLLDGTGYRDWRKFRIGKGGRVTLVQAHAYDGTLVEAANSSRLAVGLTRSVMWPG
jgi:hypothetical protein